MNVQFFFNPLCSALCALFLSSQATWAVDNQNEVASGFPSGDYVAAKVTQGGKDVVSWVQNSGQRAWRYAKRLAIRKINYFELNF